MSIELIGIVLGPISFVVLVAALIIMKKNSLSSLRVGKFSAKFGGQPSGPPVYDAAGPLRSAERALHSITGKMYAAFLGGLSFQRGEIECPPIVAEAYLYRLLLKDVRRKSMDDLAERIRLNGFTHLAPNEYERYSYRFADQTFKMWVSYIDDNFPPMGHIGREAVLEIHQHIADDIEKDLADLLVGVKDHLRRKELKEGLKG